MMDVAVLLFAGSFRAVVPEEAGQAVGLGGLYDILHVILVESPGTGIALGAHGAAELADIAGDVIVHVIGTQLAEDFLYMVLVSAGSFLAGSAGMAPV